jgi:hypothetical protein
MQSKNTHFSSAQVFFSSLPATSFDISSARLELAHVTGGSGPIWSAACTSMLFHLVALRRLQKAVGVTIIDSDPDAGHQILRAAVDDAGPIRDCANRLYLAHCQVLGLLLRLAQITKS